MYTKGLAKAVGAGNDSVDSAGACLVFLSRLETKQVGFQPTIVMGVMAPQSRGLPVTAGE